MRKTRGRSSLQTHHLGPHPILRHYLERMNFRSVIRSCLGSGLQQGLDHAEVLSVLVHNILVSRGPMYRIRQWASQIEPEAFGLTSAQVSRLNDDRIVRSLEALASNRGRSVFFRLALRVIKDFELSVPRVHFDTTTVTFFGQYASSSAEPRITHGYNKDHRPDLKQLLFGLNVTCDGSVPLLHHVFSGNRTDDSVHVRNVDQLRSMLGLDDFVYVADSKLCTTENLAHVASYGGTFVTVLPRTRKEDRAFRELLRKGAEPIRWRKFHQIPNHRRKSEPPCVYYSTNAGPQTSSEGYRIVWVRSSQKAEQDLQSRLERVRKIEVELHALSEKVGGRNLRSRKKILERVKKLLPAKLAPFLNVKVTSFAEVEHKYLRRGRPRPGDPMRKITRRRLKLVVMRDKEALKAEEATDGVFPLITNIEKEGKEGSKREILEIYKYQPYIEKRFAYTKSEYSVAPIYLKKPLRVVGLLHTYFVAIMLAALLERQVRMAMQAGGIKDIPILPEGRGTRTPTAPRILDNFDNVVWHEYEECDKLVSFPVELSEAQKQLLSLADVPLAHYR